MTRFDRDTAVTSLGADRFQGRIDRGWWIVSGPNGGYVAALFLRALAARVPGERAPRSLTVHYTAPPGEGAVEIETRVERVGRSLTTVTGRMSQQGRLVALGIAAFSTPRSGPSWHHAPMPEVAPPEACESFPSSIPIHERFDYRWAVGERPGSRAERALLGGWIRSAEPRPTDAPLITAICDAWPPPSFSVRSRDDMGVVPTIDLTVHFRCTLPLAATGAGEFVLAVFASRVAEEGFVEEDGQVWSRSGVLLAQSRQLAVIT